MNLLHGLDGLKQLPPGSALSIGNFDGMHRGHMALIGMARKLLPTAPGGVAVVTFEPHPLTVLRPEQAPPRLSSAEAKQRVLEAAGVQSLVLLPPTREVLDLTAEQFWQLIVEQMRPSHLIEGPSFFFGKGRGGSVQKLAEWSRGTDVNLHIADAIEAVLLDLSIVRVSSSLIRWLIANGRVRDAAICLGGPYQLEGTVIKGYQRGRTIGFPTANLDVLDQLVPADGVYAGRAEIDGTQYAAAVSIGTLPTFKDAKRQIEAHLIGYDGDLYGRRISVELLDWIREQRRFDGVETLKRKIQEDLREVQRRQENAAEREIGALVPKSDNTPTPVLVD